MDNVPNDFEAAIAELETIVAEIEGDDIKLEVALTKYKQGIQLIKFCQDKLVAVEQQIKILDPETESLKDFEIN